MKTVLSFFRNLDREAAWQAANYLLVSIGLISLIGFIGNVHYYLYAPCALFLFFGWYLLYRMQIRRQGVSHA